VKRLVTLMLAAAVAVLLLDLVVDVHGHYAFEERFGAHALVGFAACVGMVVLAKGWRVLVSRREGDDA
jgi:hypothetical protein